MADVTSLLTTVQGIPFEHLIISPWFIIIIVYVGATFPFAIKGILDLGGWLRDRERLKSGYMKLYKDLTNHRRLKIWAKPSGRKVTIKGEEGYPYELPIKVGKEFLGVDINYKEDPAKVTAQLQKIEKDKIKAAEKAEKMAKKNAAKTVLDIHVEKKPTEDEIRLAGDIIRRMTQ